MPVLGIPVARRLTLWFEAPRILIWPGGLTHREEVTAAGADRNIALHDSPDQFAANSPEEPVGGEPKFGRCAELHLHGQVAELQP